MNPGMRCVCVCASCAGEPSVEWHTWYKRTDGIVTARVPLATLPPPVDSCACVAPEHVLSPAGKEDHEPNMRLVRLVNAQHRITARVRPLSSARVCGSAFHCTALTPCAQHAVCASADRSQSDM